MDAILEIGLNASEWWQTTYPQWEGFFQFISLLGLEAFYLALLPLIYWCLNKQLGRHFAYVFVLANLFNNLGKHAFRGPRPYWLDPSLQLAEEPSYGIPSSHIQGATVTYLLLAGWIKRRWVWALAIVLVIFMGLSRIYLGVHFVHDVLAGFIIGGLVLIGYVIWQRKWATNFGKRILGQRLLAVVLIPVVFTLVYVVIRLIIGQPDSSVAWAAFIPEAEISSLEGMATAVASLLGLGVGITLESSRVRFRADGPIWKRVARYVVGLIGALAFWWGLKQIFPADPLWLGITLRLVRYTLVALWVSLYAPMVFVRLRLADAEPEPEINLSLR